MIERTDGVVSLMDLDPDELELDETMHLRRRQIPEEKWRRLESHAAEIFEAFGMDLNTQGTTDTPRRFIRALFDATSGYDGDPKLIKVFQTECHGGSDCR